MHPTIRLPRRSRGAGGPGRSSRSLRPVLLWAISAALAAPTALQARVPADSLARAAHSGASSVAPAASGTRDFLFGAPKASIGVRLGMNFARAGGDVFDFTTRHLTLDRGDFGAVGIALDLALRLNSRLDAVLGLAYGGTTKRSEFRDYVDEQELPIEQETSFAQLPVTAGLKAYILPRGRSIGRLAWVPARVAPYIGAGGGVVRYRFEQAGDFVDVEDLSIFTDTFTSSGWTPVAHLFTGVDIGVSPRAALTAEARYAWASAEPGADFVGFDTIDLAGLQTTVGLSWRF